MYLFHSSSFFISLFSTFILRHKNGGFLPSLLLLLTSIIFSPLSSSQAGQELASLIPLSVTHHATTSLMTQRVSSSSLPLPSSLPLLSRCQHVSLYVIIILHTSLISSSLPIDGHVWNKGNKSRKDNSSVSEGDVWEMEVDLRSSEGVNRRLYFFVRGEQEKVFVNNIPSEVEFGVCFSSSSHPYSSSSFTSSSFSLILD